MGSIKDTWRPKPSVLLFNLIMFGNVQKNIIDISDIVNTQIHLKIILLSFPPLKIYFYKPLISSHFYEKFWHIAVQLFARFVRSIASGSFDVVFCEATDAWMSPTGYRWLVALLRGVWLLRSNPGWNPNKLFFV